MDDRKTAQMVTVDTNSGFPRKNPVDAAGTKFRGLALEYRGSSLRAAILIQARPQQDGHRDTQSSSSQEPGALGAYYDQKAEECRRCAEQASDEYSRDEWLKMANGWTHLALHSRLYVPAFS
jgi:hypothetical protein